MTDVYLDGLGVLPDQPLPAGSRIRFRINGDAGCDLTAHVADGWLHVADGWLHVGGFRHRVAVEPVSPARIAVRSVQ